MRSLSLLVLLAAACAPPSTDTPTDDTGDTGDGTTDAMVYDFVARDGSGSSVSYGGQVFRNVLIADLDAYLDGLTERLDTTYFPAEGDVEAALGFYFDFDDGAGAAVAHGVSTTPAPKQTTYGDISSGKDLAGKIAGNDPTGQHEDWSTAMIGWDAEGVTTPESLVRHWFGVLDDLAVARSGSPTKIGDVVVPVVVTPEGVHLQELLQKFLLGAVAWSQAADDYLDDDTEGKGLLSDHTAVEEGEVFTALEHAWDEGFGYLGASRTYGRLSLEAQQAGGADDADGDGKTDLLSEVTFAMAGYAAKRRESADTDHAFPSRIWTAFVEGRQLLADTDGALTEAQLSELTSHRDAALDAWEEVLAANVVHYLNATLADLAASGEAYDVVDHGKHWSEAKGFALGLQFRDSARLSDSDQVTLHALLGQGPELGDAQARDDRADDLIAAKELLGDAYGFGAGDLGDDDGTNGW